MHDAGRAEVDCLIVLEARLRDRIVPAAEARRIAIRLLALDCERKRTLIDRIGAFLDDNIIVLVLEAIAIRDGNAADARRASALRQMIGAGIRRRADAIGQDRNLVLFNGLPGDKTFLRRYATRTSL